jgi:hypothetical protein
MLKTKQNKKSLRHIKKRRASHRKINKYQIGGTVSRENLLDLFEFMNDVDKKMIIKMHEQVENIDDINKNINNIKAIFNYPSAFFQKDDEKKTIADELEKNNKDILAFIVSNMNLDINKQAVLWAFLAMYISQTYLVDIETGVKLAFLLYNNSKTTSVKFTDDKDKVITSVIEYIKNRNDHGAIKFLKSSPLRQTISLDTYNFMVRNSYINYIDLIGDTRLTTNEHRHYYNNIVKDIKSHIEKKHIQWKHAEKLHKKELAKKKLEMIREQMPKFLYSKYDPFQERDVNYFIDKDGNKFDSTDEKAKELFNPVFYGWTAADSKDLRYNEPEMLWAKAQLDEALSHR